MKKLMRFFLIWVLALALLFANLQTSTAQTDMTLRIDEIQSENFPQMGVNISALDAAGYPLPGLAADNFTVSEDGNVVSGFQVTPINQHPVQLIIALDTTQSMQYGPQPTPLKSSVEAARQFLGGLGAPDQASVISFGDKAFLLQALTTDKAQLQTALDNLPEGSSTALNDALILAASNLKGMAGRSVIILLTDGTDSGVSQASFEEALRAVLDMKGVVYPIGWGGANKANLKKLADLTHGEFQFLSGSYPDATALQGAFNRVLSPLPEYRTQYKISYQSGLPADGNEHQVAVSLDNLGLHAEQIQRFVATQGQIFMEFPTLSDGQVVGGKVTFAPSIDAPAPMQQLEILIDGQPLTSVVAEPFTFEWDSSQVTPGEHEFKFVARDTAGNTGEASINLAVAPPLVVQILQPSGGQQVQGSVLIAAQVDALAKIARVEFNVDGKLLGQVENPPYEMTWPAARASEGAHDITVTAYDANGYTAEDTVRVSVATGGASAMGGGAIIGAVALAAAALVVVVVLSQRRRKRKAEISTQGETPVSEPSGATPSGGAVLRERQGLNPDHVWMLAPYADITLGRKRDENDIPLMGATASRRHAIIRSQGGYYYLINQRLENPLLVNGSPVTVECILNPGDVIQAGDSIFEFDNQAS